MITFCFLPFLFFSVSVWKTISNNKGNLFFWLPCNEAVRQILEFKHVSDVEDFSSVLVG